MQDNLSKNQGINEVSLNNKIKEILEKKYHLFIEDERGKGSFKNVYLCRYQTKNQTKKQLIVKLANDKAITDLQNEYENSLKFKFRTYNIIKIVKIKYFEIENENFCIGICRIDGNKNLRQIMKDESLPTLQNAIQLQVEILIGISQLNYIGIQHYDLKPENIVKADDIFQIIDVSSPQQIEKRVTSCNYIPIDYKPQVNIKNYDIYSLGITLLEYLRVVEIQDKKVFIKDVQQYKFRVYVDYIKHYMLNQHDYQRQSIVLMLKILRSTFYYDFTKFQNYLTKLLKEERLDQRQKALIYIDLHIIKNDKLNQKHPRDLQRAEQILSEKDLKIDPYYKYLVNLEFAEFYHAIKDIDNCQKYLQKLKDLERDEIDQENHLLYLRLNYFKLLFEIEYHNNQMNDSEEHLKKALQLTKLLEKDHPQRLYFEYLQQQYFEQFSFRRSQNVHFYTFYFVNQVSSDLNYPTDYLYVSLLEKQANQLQNYEREFIHAEYIFLEMKQIYQNVYRKANFNIVQMLEKLSINQQYNQQKDLNESLQTIKDDAIGRITNFNKMLDLEGSLSKLQQQLHHIKEILKQEINDFEKQYFECLGQILHDRIQKKSFLFLKFLSSFIRIGFQTQKYFKQIINKDNQKSTDFSVFEYNFGVEQSKLNNSPNSFEQHIKIAIIQFVQQQISSLQNFEKILNSIKFSTLHLLLQSKFKRERLSKIMNLLNLTFSFTEDWNQILQLYLKNQQQIRQQQNFETSNKSLYVSSNQMQIDLNSFQTHKFECQIQDYEAQNYQQNQPYQAQDSPNNANSLKNSYENLSIEDNLQNCYNQNFNQRKHNFYIQSEQFINSINQQYQTFENPNSVDSLNQRHVNLSDLDSLLNYDNQNFFRSKKNYAIQSEQFEISNDQQYQAQENQNSVDSLKYRHINLSHQTNLSNQNSLLNQNYFDKSQKNFNIFSEQFQLSYTNNNQDYQDAIYHEQFQDF
ncbi:hypothetical protein ABPG74_017240 [Tetrahymena malaccensis]